MKRGKAQYSLEFLVTYGWALLIIGIVLSAIYTFGWVDASNFLPQRCTFYGQTGCKDFYVSEDNFSLSLVNNYGVKLNITGMEFQIEGDVICPMNDFSPHIEWNRSSFAVVSRDLFDVSCDAGLRDDHISSGSRVIATVIIEFFSPLTCPSGTADCRHNSTGSVVTKVQ